MNRLLRLLIVGIAALFGGLAIYSTTGGLGGRFGETGATLWFIGSMLVAGYLTHRVLPKEDTTGLVTESMFVVDCEGDVVSCARPDGETEKVAWGDLQRIEIITTDEGPWAPDVFWALHGSNGGCMIPQGATGGKRLLERIQQLPGYDDNAVIQAMGCTSNNTFLVWSRST